MTDTPTRRGPRVVDGPWLCCTHLSGESLLPGSSTAVFSGSPGMAEGVRQLSRVSLMRAPIP